MDISATLLGYLEGATGIPWLHNAPKGAPAEFGTLARDGGPSGVGRDEPTLTLLVHAASRARAA